MPNCFSLASKATGERVNLEEVDAGICELTDIAPHPERWCCDWYNTIGFLLATGSHLDRDDHKGLSLKKRLRNVFFTYTDNPDEEVISPDKQEYLTCLEKIVDWMTERYTSDGWA